MLHHVTPEKCVSSVPEKLPSNRTICWGREKHTKKRRKMKKINEQLSIVLATKLQVNKFVTSEKWWKFEERKKIRKEGKLKKWHKL